MSYNDEVAWPERMGPERKGDFFGLGAYKSVDYPMIAEGNVYVDKAKAFDAESNPVEDAQFRAQIELINKEDGIYLEIRMDNSWLQRQRKLVTTELLGKAEIPNTPFVSTDGTPYYLDLDYSGNKRNTKNPAPGPFERIEDGLMTVKVWSR